MRLLRCGVILSLLSSCSYGLPQNLYNENKCIEFKISREKLVTLADSLIELSLDHTNIKKKKKAITLLSNDWRTLVSPSQAENALLNDNVTEFELKFALITIIQLLDCENLNMKIFNQFLHYLETTGSQQIPPLKIAPNVTGYNLLSFKFLLALAPAATSLHLPTIADVLMQFTKDNSSQFQSYPLFALTTKYLNSKMRTLEAHDALRASILQLTDNGLLLRNILFDPAVVNVITTYLQNIESDNNVPMDYSVFYRVIETLRNLTSMIGMFCRSHFYHSEHLRSIHVAPLFTNPYRHLISMIDKTVQNSPLLVPPMLEHFFLLRKIISSKEKDNIERLNMKLITQKAIKSALHYSVTTTSLENMGDSPLENLYNKKTLSHGVTNEFDNQEEKGASVADQSGNDYPANKTDVEASKSLENSPKLSPSLGLVSIAEEIRKDRMLALEKFVIEGKYPSRLFSSTYARFHNLLCHHHSIATTKCISMLLQYVYHFLYEYVHKSSTPHILMIKELGDYSYFTTTPKVKRHTALEETYDKYYQIHWSTDASHQLLRSYTHDENPLLGNLFMTAKCKPFFLNGQPYTMTLTENKTTRLSRRKISEEIISPLLFSSDEEKDRIWKCISTHLKNEILAIKEIERYFDKKKLHYTGGNFSNMKFHRLLRPMLQKKGLLERPDLMQLISNNRYSLDWLNEMNNAVTQSSEREVGESLSMKDKAEPPLFTARYSTNSGYAVLSRGQEASDIVRDDTKSASAPNAFKIERDLEAVSFTDKLAQDAKNHSNIKQRANSIDPQSFGRQGTPGSGISLDDGGLKSILRNNKGQKTRKKVEFHVEPNEDAEDAKNYLQIKRDLIESGVFFDTEMDFDETSHKCSYPDLVLSSEIPKLKISYKLSPETIKCREVLLTMWNTLISETDNVQITSEDPTSFELSDTALLNKVSQQAYERFAEHLLKGDFEGVLKVLYTYYQRSNKYNLVQFIPLKSAWERGIQDFITAPEDAEIVYLSLLNRILLQSSSLSYRTILVGAHSTFFNPANIEALLYPYDPSERTIQPNALRKLDYAFSAVLEALGYVFSNGRVTNDMPLNIPINSPEFERKHVFSSMDEAIGDSNILRYFAKASSKLSSAENSPGIASTEAQSIKIQSHVKLGLASVKDSAFASKPTSSLQGLAKVKIPLKDHDITSPFPNFDSYILEQHISTLRSLCALSTPIIYSLWICTTLQAFDLLSPDNGEGVTHSLKVFDIRMREIFLTGTSRAKSGDDVDNLSQEKNTFIFGKDSLELLELYRTSYPNLINVIRDRIQALTSIFTSSHYNVFHLLIDYLRHELTYTTIQDKWKALYDLIIFPLHMFLRQLSPIERLKFHNSDDYTPLNNSSFKNIDTQSLGAKKNTEAPLSKKRTEDDAGKHKKVHYGGSPVCIPEQDSEYQVEDESPEARQIILEQVVERVKSIKRSRSGYTHPPLRKTSSEDAERQITNESVRVGSLGSQDLSGGRVLKINIFSPCKTNSASFSYASPHRLRVNNFVSPDSSFSRTDGNSPVHASRAYKTSLEDIENVLPTGEKRSYNSWSKYYRNLVLSSGEIPTSINEMRGDSPVLTTQEDIYRKSSGDDLLSSHNKITSALRKQNIETIVKHTTAGSVVDTLSGHIVGENRKNDTMRRINLLSNTKVVEEGTRRPSGITVEVLEDKVTNNSDGEKAKQTNSNLNSPTVVDHNVQSSHTDAAPHNANLIPLHVTPSSSAATHYRPSKNIAQKRRKHSRGLWTRFVKLFCCLK